jgi:hypothetical protein
LGDIFQKKMRPTPKDIAPVAKFHPIWSHWQQTIDVETKVFFFPKHSPTSFAPKQQQQSFEAESIYPKHKQCDQGSML